MSVYYFESNNKWSALFGDIVNCFDCKQCLIFQTVTTGHTLDLLMPGHIQMSYLFLSHLKHTCPIILQFVHIQSLPLRCLQIGQQLHSGPGTHVGSDKFRELSFMFLVMVVNYTDDSKAFLVDTDT